MMNIKENRSDVYVQYSGSKFAKPLRWFTPPGSFNVSFQSCHKTVYIAMLEEECTVCRTIPLHQGHLLSISRDTEAFKIRHFNTHWPVSTLSVITS
jgi:hypothetical protein